MREEHGQHWRVGAVRWGAAVLTTVTVIAVAVLAAAFAAHLSERTRVQEARAQTADAASRIERQVDHYVEALRGIAAWIRTDGWPTRTEYHRFAGAVAVRSRYPGIQVIGMAEYVDAAQRTAFSARTASATATAMLSYPEFRIKPAGTGAALPITYLDPVGGNEAALGLDFLSEPHRRTAALAARDLATPRLTAPTTLVQETGTQRGTLMMVPVYRTGAIPSTVAERRAAFSGVVYAAFRMGDLADGALGPDADRLWLDDAGVADPAAAALYTTPSRNPRSDAVEETDLAVAGRHWRIRYAAAPNLGPVTRYGPLGLGIGGAAVAVLAGALLLALTSTRARARSLAASMTAELRSVTDTATDAIVTVDYAGQVTAWNRGAARMFGIAPGAILGAPLDRVIPGGLAVLTGRNASAGGHPDPTVEVAATRADGTVLHVEASVSTWESPRGVFATAILRDVTERRRVETEVRRTNDLLEGVLRGATECAIIGCDARGLITVFNEGAHRMLGYRAEEAIGKAALDLLHDPAEMAAMAHELGVSGPTEVFPTLMKNGGPSTREWTYVRSDGYKLPVLLTVTSLRDRDGAIEGHIGIAFDLTEAHRLERERARMAHRFEQLVDCSGEGIYGLDRNGLITFVNKQAARSLGWSVDELVGRPAHTALHHHRPDGSPFPPDDCPIIRSIVDGSTHRVDTEVFWRRDGAPVPVEYVSAPLRRDGQIDGVVVTFADITDRKRTEQALKDAVASEREAASHLREIDQVRTDLVSTVSHELRTPLTSISGYLELLMDGDVGPITSDQAAMVKVAHRSSQRLLLLVEDLLTLSRIDAGAFRIRQDDVDLASLLSAAVGAVAPLAAARDLRLDADFPPDLGVVRGDAAHLDRVLLNLLSNGVKFTPPGGSVTLTGRRVGDEAVVTVADTGIGIPEDEQSRLFDRFFRSSNAMDEAIQGTGLGLSIVKTIVEHHGGRISAESRLGDGTTFTLTLPVRAPVRA
ncbi:PAS domain S-box protein [Cryptosporangium aurantiacum]|uniref:histidine kinase n=1 Tax=Cryptosporangium aurantiacum TaxID=134849 RepID=A0A1M7QAJ0_9ACTN|nr:PAS domain S-box protein [Cryptosporangium aurantiacum]SHN27759.1 PAS domain S-box-containing protein [Cryptosporangium aurantiacum]